MQLSEKTKKNLSELLGISYEKLINMDDDEIRLDLEKKTGKKVKWPKDAKVDGLPIKTMEDVNKGLDRLIKKNDDGWDR